jgi:hypothetical protein
VSSLTTFLFLPLQPSHYPGTDGSADDHDPGTELQNLVAGAVAQGCASPPKVLLSQKLPADGRLFDGERPELQLAAPPVELLF